MQKRKGPGGTRFSVMSCKHVSAMTAESLSRIQVEFNIRFHVNFVLSANTYFRQYVFFQEISIPLCIYRSAWDCKRPIRRLNTVLCRSRETSYIQKDTWNINCRAVTYKRTLCNLPTYSHKKICTASN